MTSGTFSADRWHAPAAAGPVAGTVRLPGSKSMTNRALVLAALASGPAAVRGPLHARDTTLMAGAMRALGADLSQDGDGGWRVIPGTPAGPVTVDVGNAGTVLRFVPPAAALTSVPVTFRGDPRASARPVGPLLAGLAGLGAQIDDGGRGALPFTVQGQGGLAGGTVTLDASASSQLVSGLLLAAPRFAKGIELRHEGPPVPSAPHLAMTVAMLRAAGAEVETGSRVAGTGADGPVTDLWRVHPGPLAPGTMIIEPDLVNAAPFLAAALITGGTVTIAGWPAVTTQPAAQILEVLTAMGAAAGPVPGGMRFTGTGTVRGVTADLRDVSELSPVLTALAAQASGPSEFTGIGHQRAQESNRLAALAEQVSAYGAEVSELADGVAIVPRPLRSAAAPFASYDDHRLVMAAAVLGLGVPGGLWVAGAATVGKTFPEFPAQWAALTGGPGAQAPAGPPGVAP